MATVKITNTLTTVVNDGCERLTVISPTGITTPCTPIQEYIDDMATFSDGVLTIPTYNSGQTINIPTNAYIEFEIDNYKEIAYYETLNIAGAKIEVTDGITTVEIPDSEPNDGKDTSSGGEGGGEGGEGGGEGGEGGGET